jgi:cardiolipin synthase A/B
MNYYQSTFLLVIAAFYLTGFIFACIAILRARTPQGTVAWIVGLITMPFFVVPLFVFFGRSKFYGYTSKRKTFDEKVDQKMHQLEYKTIENESNDHHLQSLLDTLRPLCRPAFTDENKVTLLIDAECTYASMLQAIEQAEKYIIFQFYTFRADAIGNKFSKILIRKAREGIKVNVLYDEIGSDLPKEFISELTAAGVEVSHFNSLTGKGKLQINFRNHRKILIIDGNVAYVGGLNIGDEYLGRWKSMGPWRDTHLRLEGPSVVACQLVHAKDWYWCTQKELELDWKIKSPGTGNAKVMVLPSGPADARQKCLLSHVAMINAAQKRLWIANPYFVPPESLMDAILLASLRGVDVRVILPSYCDSWFVMAASKVYIPRLMQHGVKVFRYNAGFSHQKVILIDDMFASVGSANFDFRSMFINFEVTIIVQQAEFQQQIVDMLLADFAQSEQVSCEEFEQMSLWDKILTKGANLLAPVL